MQREPNFFFSRNPSEIIIDEAQELPVLFNVLRGVVEDNRQKKGRFLLIGSSSPELITSVTESLSGRIGVVNLSPLKANEIYEQPLSRFYEIFNDKLNVDNIISGEVPLSLEQMQNTWLRGVP